MRTEGGLLSSAGIGEGTEGGTDEGGTDEGDTGQLPRNSARAPVDMTSSLT